MEDPDQTAPKEQSDQDFHCLSFHLHLFDASSRGRNRHSLGAPILDGLRYTLWLLKKHYTRRFSQVLLKRRHVY